MDNNDLLFYMECKLNNRGQSCGNAVTQSYKPQKTISELLRGKSNYISSDISR